MIVQIRLNISLIRDVRNKLNLKHNYRTFLPFSLYYKSGKNDKL